MDIVIIRTKAGDIPVCRKGERAVRLRIPIEFKDHGLHPQSELNVRAARITEAAEMHPNLQGRSTAAETKRLDGKIRTRMFDGPVEDPATGSAASTLAVYLARKWGTHGTREFDIVQGVEIGRRSEIGVRVELGDDAVVKKVELAGKAVTVMNGRGLSGMYE
uniref:Diaminopimelate epimerase-like protein n=1 Tax=Moniliophthora roreri TaxID=221103 RepID=A0A0W0EYZ0_MONRR